MVDRGEAGLVQTGEERIPLHARRSIRYGPVGKVTLSVDFLVAVPIGVSAGGFLGFAKSAISQAPTILLAITALLASLAGIVIAAHTIMISLMNADYFEIIEQAGGGIKGLSWPYILVIRICVIGVIISLLSALAWPIVPTGADWEWRAARGGIFGTSVFLGVWGLLGAAQLASLGAWHFEQKAKLMKAHRELNQATRRTSR